MVNTICLRKFVKAPLQNGSWKDIPPNFGIIKGLHLDFLEFPNKIKKNAPPIPDPSYSGKAYDTPEILPPPDSGGKGQKQRGEKGESSPKHASPQEERSGGRGSGSRSTGSGSTGSGSGTGSSESSINENEMNFLEEFGATPQKKDERESGSESPSLEEDQEERDAPQPEGQTKHTSLPKYVPVPKLEEEIDPTELYIREQVELRSNINDLKRLHEKGVDIGFDHENLNTVDLQTSRILLESAKKVVSVKKSIDMNKFGLMGTFFAVDKGAGLLTDKMKGYFQYQMDIIHVYDDLLEELGETQLNTMLQDLDPSLKLIGLGGLTTVGFYLLQNYVGEDKVKQAKLIQQFFPKQAKFIDEITTASKKQKDLKTEGTKTSAAKKPKRRGPSYNADDINRM